MDNPLGDSTVFIDVAEGNAFSGLLDNFAKELQNENIEVTATEIDHQEVNECPAEIKTEIVISKEDYSDLIEGKSECTKAVSKAQTGRIRCPECHRYTAEDEEQLSRHIRKVHKGENPFQCYMCEYSTYNKVLFEEHIHIHKGIKPYKCSFCSHKSVSKKNLKKHELIHRSDNPLKCDKCDYIARHRKGLAHHFRSFHPKQGDLMCALCNKVFSTAVELANHVPMQSKCNICNYSTCSTSLLETHISKHTNRKPNKRLRTKKGLFKCATCKWSCFMYKRLHSRILLHLVHHPNQVVDESLIDVSILKKHGIM